MGVEQAWAPSYGQTCASCTRSPSLADSSFVVVSVCAVGLVYGLAMLATRDLAVPVMAHVTANIASGALWMGRRGGGGGEDRAAD